MYTDSDWGGIAKERRSTSGGALFKGGHLLKAWAKTQGAVSLSSMESELYAAVFGAVEMKGTQRSLQDWGRECSCALFVHASAALGFKKARRHRKSQACRAALALSPRGQGFRQDVDVL